MMDRQQQTGSSPHQGQETSDRLAQQARDKSQEVVQKAQDTAKSTISNQKGQAAQMVGTIADALRQTGTHLSDQDQAAIGHLATRAADQLDSFSNDLQSKSVDEMIGGVQDFARREPGLFLGGAVVVGLLAARFFKSSGERRQMRQPQYRGQFGSSGSQGYYTPQGMADYRRTVTDEYAGSRTLPQYPTSRPASGTTGQTGQQGTPGQRTAGDNFPASRPSQFPSETFGEDEGENPPFRRTDQP